MKPLVLTALAVVLAASAYTDPPTDYILALSGRYTSAHACPISPDLALTAAHVVVPHFGGFAEDPEAGLLPYRIWSPAGGVGFARGYGTSEVADLATIRLSVTLAHWYSLAPALVPGEKVWWVGYDFGNRGNSYSRKVFDSKVIRDTAGLLTLDRDTPQGSSGSCLLNEAGEVIGVIVARRRLDNEDMQGIATAVYGPWREITKVAE